MHTSPLQKNLLKVFPDRQAALAVEVLLLLLLGMAAMAVHSKLRIPMHLPGKQGVLFIALVVTGRGLSRIPFAASLTCIGSAMMLLIPGMGFHDPFMAVSYVLLGGVMDLIFRITTKFSDNPAILALACGVAWMFIPLFRLIISAFFAVPMNLFSTGIAYPFVTHMLFGFGGGLIGAGIVFVFTRRS